jgi:hypothetical protein
VVESEQRNPQTRVDEGKSFGVPIAGNVVASDFCTPA